MVTSYLVTNVKTIVSFFLSTFVPENALWLLCFLFPFMAIRLGIGVPWALGNSELLKLCFGWIKSLL